MKCFRTIFIGAWLFVTQAQGQVAKGVQKEHLDFRDVFFGKEDVYQVCYPKSHRMYFEDIIFLSLATIFLLIIIIVNIRVVKN